ncbi:MAG: hypothetical protein ACI9SB_000608 [Candidatus Azotimanducaceae bacterium]|jgi:hypothetical protein
MTTSQLMSKFFNMTQPRQALPEKSAEMRKHGYQSDRRSTHRRTAIERLLIQITGCTNADKIGTTVSCHSTQMSAGGMTISADVHIPAGSLVDLWVSISAVPGKFFLSADVRWSRLADNGLYQLGVEFIDGDATDTIAWRALHA